MNAPFLLAVNRLWERIADIIDADSIFKATGNDLDLVLSGNFNFPRKQEATAIGKWKTEDSTTGTVIVAGDLTFRADNNATFTNTTGGTVDASGVLEVEIECDTAGSIGNVEAGEITGIITPVAGIVTGINESATEGGQDQETDINYRNRFVYGRYQSYWNTDGIYSAIIEVSGVTSARVIENDSNSALNIGIGQPIMPPKSRRYYIEGGEARDLAIAIYNKTDRAIEETGTVSVEVTDIQGDTRLVKFSRPNTISLDYTYDIDGTVDETALKSAIEEYVASAGIGAKISNFNAKNYIENIVDLSNLNDLIITFRRTGDANLVSSIQLELYENAIGVYVV